MDENMNTPVEETAEQTAESSNKAMKDVYEWVDSIVVSIVAVIVLFAFIFRVVGIVGNSMNNTLYNNDRVIIFNFMYEPKAGDIVVISRNVTNDKKYETLGNEPIIKRVIATEGQQVDVQYGEDGVGHVFVDGHQIGDSYIKEPMRNIKIWNAVSFPQTVPEGHIFVLGDNRNDSLDSRSNDIGEFGMVDVRYVLGKALLRIYPFDSMGVVK